MEGLQPGTDHDSAALGDQLEAVHGFADEVRGLVPGMRDVVHAEEVRRIDHGREHVAVAGHLHDVLPGMREVDGTLPCHHAKDIEREQDAGGVKFAVGFFQESGDDVGALDAVGFGLRALGSELCIPGYGFGLRSLGLRWRCRLSYGPSVGFRRRQDDIFVLWLPRLVTSDVGCG